MVLSALLLLQLDASVVLGEVPGDSVRVFLLRHGQAHSNLDPAPDLPPDQLDRLTELGREQARHAARFLKGRGVSAVLTSPAGRARESAEEVRAVLGLDAVRVEPRIRPLDLGRARDGSPLDWDQRIAEWEAGRDGPVPGGESLEQLGARVLAAVRSLRSDYAGKSVLLVAHGEVIAALAGALDGTPGPQRWPPRSRNGSLTVVDAGPQGLPRLRLADHVPSDADAGTP